MDTQRGLTRYKLLVSGLILLVIFFLSVNNAGAIAPVENERPIYEIPISDSTQDHIWKICEENQFSFELILSIYEVEGFGKIRYDEIKSDIDTLVYYRDYWGKQEYPDEFVFNLILIARLRGLEGCLTYMQHTESYDLNGYVEAVAAYKFNLEQTM